MDKKKLGTIIFAIVCVLIVVVCIIIQVIMNKQTQELEKESEKIDTLVTTTTSGVEVETQYMGVEENKFFVKVPTSFRKLSSEEISKKYSEDVPSVVFSNDEETINVEINITDNNMKNSEIKTYMDNVIKENGDKMISSNYYEVDNHNIGQIKMNDDNNIYNNKIFFSNNDKLVIITFNCTKNLQEEWQGVGDFIIDSLFFTE